jgi:hypothetical protein
MVGGRVVGGCVVGGGVVVGATVVGAGGRVVRGRVTGGAVVSLAGAAVEIGSSTELLDDGTVVDAVAVDAVVVDAVVVVVTCVEGGASDGAAGSVTRIRSTVGSAESSWNAAITTRLATMTATSAPMNPLFLGTYPAKPSGTSNSFRLSV